MRNLERNAVFANYLFEKKHQLAEPEDPMHPLLVAPAKPQGDLANPLIPQPEYSLTLGYKQYELTNHLGNVQVTLSDRKLGLVQNENSTFSSYTADVLSAVDYYPFGMAMLGRSGEGIDYRYGYNGQEMDAGFEGYYNFKYRIHDSRLCRFLSIDPLFSMYSYNSPFVFGENRVIDGIELEGLEWKKATDADGNVTEVRFAGNDENGKPKEGTSSHVAWRQSVTEITVTFQQSSGETTVNSQKSTYLRVGHQDGCVDEYKANDSHRVQLPKLPEVYNTYNQNGKDNWGIVSGIAAIINASVDFGKIYSGEKIAWGDLNSSNGKAIPIDNGSHHGGSLQADVRLLSTKGGSVQGKYNEMSFDPTRTTDFFQIMYNNGFSKVLLHKSPASDVQETAIKIKPRSTDHKDHYHFQSFRGKKR